MTVIWHSETSYMHSGISFKSQHINYYITAQLWYQSEGSNKVKFFKKWNQENKVFNIKIIQVTLQRER